MPDYLTLKADSVTGVHQVKAEMKIKPETPPDARIAYKIRNVYIHDDNELIGSTPDTLQYEQYYLITAQNNLKFAALKQGIFLKPGELYSRSDYVETIRYLNELAIIRNANLKFLQKGPEELDVMLYLSQRKRFAYSAEFNTVFQSTNYFGPGVIFSYTDRNSNNGAEILKINLNGSFEMQIVDGKINPAYQLGFDISYLVPRFYPKFLFNSEKKNLPKTNISAGYNLFNRLDLYRLNSIYTNFGYRWSKTDRISHSFNPIEVVFTKLPGENPSHRNLSITWRKSGCAAKF